MSGAWAGAFEALGVSLRVACAATVLAGVPGVLLGRALARREFRGKLLVETLVALPLVLPPTAVGFLLLFLLARDGLLGERALGFDLGLVLSARGAAVAAAVMAFPLITRGARVAFEGVPVRLERMATSLGHGPWAVARRVTLPLAARGLGAALLLGFSRALGEFGATMVVAGSLAGETRTLSLAIFEELQLGNDARALRLVALAAALAFASVLAAERLLRGRSEARR